MTTISPSSKTHSKCLLDVFLSSNAANRQGETALDTQQLTEDGAKALVRFT